MGCPRFYINTHKPTAEQMRKLRELVAEKGIARSSVTLGVGDHALLCVLSGGGLQRKTNERLCAALDAVEVAA